MSAKPRRGRPPRANKAATERIEIRATRAERTLWEHNAAVEGVTLSQWIRSRLNVRAVLLGPNGIEDP